VNSALICTNPLMLTARNKFSTESTNGGQVQMPLT